MFLNQPLQTEFSQNIKKYDDAVIKTETDLMHVKTQKEIKLL